MNLFSYIVYAIVVVFFAAIGGVSIVKWWNREFISNAFPAVFVMSLSTAIIVVLPEMLCQEPVSGYTISVICFAELPVCTMLFVDNHWAVLKFMVPAIFAACVTFVAFRVSRHFPLVIDIQLFISIMSVVITMVVMIWSVISRIRNIHKWLYEMNIYGGILDRVNFLYLLLLLACQISGLFLGRCSGWRFMIISLLSLFIALGLVVAVFVRLHRRHIFLLKRKLEEDFMAAVKMYMKGMAKNFPREDISFKSIYDRIVDYFDKEKPFLKSKLSIGEVSRHLLTNKVYVSRAINQYTGKNFCQFVNFYRIRYAAGLFQSDPNIKVSELASLAGFNSGVSFNMAFRLYMNISPGEWCREIRGSPRK